MQDLPIRVGLVGTGFGISNHLPAWRALPNVEVTALYSSDEARGSKIATDHGIPRSYHDFDEFITSPDFELVDIASTPELHAPQSLAAFEAGKHVICEKPMATSTNEVLVMTRAARESGLVHAVNHEFRFLPLQRKVHEIVSSGELGRIVLVITRVNSNLALDPTQRSYWWSRISTRQRGGGAIMQLFSHFFDLYAFWFGRMSNVAGAISKAYPERPVPAEPHGVLGPDMPTLEMRAVETEDTAAFHASLLDGGLFSFAGSTSVYHPSGFGLEVYGDEGTLIVQGASAPNRPMAESIFVGRKGDRQLRQVDHGEEPWLAKSGLPPLQAGMAAEFADVVRTVQGSSQPGTFTTFDDGLYIHELMEGLIEAGERAARSL